MRELRAILQAWRGLAGRDAGAVLATVVHVTGSAYRRPGARMLIIPDGRRIGSVSGGCLEADLIRKAWWFTESGAPVVQVYDTSPEDDTDMPFELGCNGVTHILLERVDTPAAAAMLAFLEDCAARRMPAVIATAIRTQARGIAAGDRSDAHRVRRRRAQPAGLQRRLRSYGVAARARFAASKAQPPGACGRD